MVKSGHGGDILAVSRKLGCRVDEIADMSSNLAPLGIAPGVEEAIVARLAEIAYLPETGSESLRQCLADHYGRKTDEILVGNGTTEFIFGVPAAIKPARAIIVNPTYSDYRLSCQWAGIEVVDFNLGPDNDFRLDLMKLSGTLSGGELVFICNPNNPTGSLTTSRQLHDFFSSHQDSLFMVDEAYLPFNREASLLELPPLDNLLVLNSYSKIFCVPGLRLGFLVAPAATMQLLEQRSKPWGVNRLAQVAGEFLCFNGAAYIEKTVSFLEREIPLFTGGLNELPGVKAFASKANFILGYLRGELRGGELREKMLEKRIVIRNCENFSGLDDRYFRVSLKDSATNKRCLRELADIIKGA